jgi:hypothetical protein
MIVNNTEFLTPLPQLLLWKISDESYEVVKKSDVHTADMIKADSGSTSLC